MSANCVYACLHPEISAPLPGHCCLLRKTINPIVASQINEVKLISDFKVFFRGVGKDKFFWPRQKGNKFKISDI